eukprot:5948541-Alexandrium_andersonii.AAC.1
MAWGCFWAPSRRSTSVLGPTGPRWAPGHAVRAPNACRQRALAQFKNRTPAGRALSYAGALALH